MAQTKAIKGQLSTEAKPAAAPRPKTAVKTAAKAAKGAVKGTVKAGGPTPSHAAHSANPSIAEILGQITWLMLQSPAHRHAFISELEWRVVPALNLRQMRIYRQDNKPVAFVSWAFVSPEVEARVKAGGAAAKLMPGEWKCGAAPMLVDLVAPFGGGDRFAQEVLATVKDGPKVG